ncbi:hypothetical protein ACIA8K_18840 [Catenuloplanes sp. NPDC051500]|uniref:AMIN-like domain-containing (lipo)protein n=1 Tax=Catenuloplanes sp. NPDC051500 TaxID=3363959 RepID=UPI0037954357
MRKVIRGVVSALVASVLLVAAGGGAAPAAAAPFCGLTWGSGDRTAGELSTAGLLEVRTGRHECWDRVVFEFNGSAQGYAVAYRTEVLTEGRGLDLVPYTAGGAWLRVSLRAPSDTFGATVGEHTANVLPYDTLRDVVYGGTFEGYSTFAVGVRARLPFRLLTLPGPGTHSRIVLDVAHQW